MRSIVFFLEEPSAKEFIKNILNKVVDKLEDYNIHYIVFQGKQDLEKSIENKIKYWQLPNTLFCILRDQDSGDCIRIKNALKEKIDSIKKPEITLIRIACHELESWYFGDLKSVELALGVSGLHEKYAHKKFYRTPDSREIGKFANPEDNSSVSFQCFITGLQEKIKSVFQEEKN